MLINFEVIDQKVKVFKQIFRQELFSFPFKPSKKYVLHWDDNLKKYARQRQTRVVSEKDLGRFNVRRRTLVLVQ